MPASCNADPIRGSLDPQDQTPLLPIEIRNHCLMSVYNPLNLSSLADSTADYHTGEVHIRTLERTKLVWLVRHTAMLHLRWYILSQQYTKGCFLGLISFNTSLYLKHQSSSQSTTLRESQNAVVRALSVYHFEQPKGPLKNWSIDGAGFAARGPSTKSKISCVSGSRALYLHLCLFHADRGFSYGVSFRFVQSQRLDNTSWTSSLLNMLIPGSQQGRPFTVTLSLSICRSSKAIPSLQLGRSSCGSSVCTASFAIVADHVDDGSDDKSELHDTDEDVDDPDGPAGETEADDHIDAEDPCVLQTTNLQAHPYKYSPNSSFQDGQDGWWSTPGAPTARKQSKQQQSPTH
ncbi:hypothetical protein KCU59_g83, partial [Aureobasidium melanogenum]